MVWYYAEGDRQKGPISDEEFQELVNKGRIHNETLIWKDGMDNWQPLENMREAGLVNISPALPPVSGMPETPVPPAVENPAADDSTGKYAPPTATQTSLPPPAGSAPASAPPSPNLSNACAQCGRSPLGPYEGVQLGNLLLCRECDAELSRHYNQAGQHSTGAAPYYLGDSTTTGAGPGSVDMPYASILARAAAKIIDNLLESVLLLIVIISTADLQILADVADEMTSSSSAEVILLLRPYLLAMLAFRIVYETVLIGKFGATLGKMALGIRVVASDGTAARFNHAIIRAIAPAILQLPGLFMPESGFAFIAQMLYLFAYLIAIFDVQRRTLFDHAANTRVVR